MATLPSLKKKQRKGVCSRRLKPAVYTIQCIPAGLVLKNEKTPHKKVLDKVSGARLINMDEEFYRASYWSSPAFGGILVIEQQPDIPVGEACQPWADAPVWGTPTGSG